ncbi:TonB-dependent receptor plug domain-containing protein [Halobacteriovorax sp. DPLXC-1]|uniref:TonB-dependent receptor plug domain-containing protein n=1 Tax=Halobacteriovorax sp. DPLXC-1 TaxID=3110771 RepID=UPI003FA5A833
MSRRKIIKTPLILLSIVSLPIHADIFIKASKLETLKEKITSDVTVITAQEIEDSGATTLQELLQGRSSVFIPQTGGLGSIASFNLRGLPTGFSKVIIDNIELVDPTDINNSFQVNNLLLENIESIEILKGSQSILYGSNAVGGVLKINTKKGHKNNSLNLEYGSLNTVKAGLQSSGNSDKLNYGLSASYLSSDGYSAVNEDRIENAEDDSFKNLNLNLNLSYLLNEQLEFNYQGQLLDSEVEIDGFESSPPYGPIDVVENDLNEYLQSNHYLGFNYFSEDEKLTITPSIRYSHIKREDPTNSFTPLYKGNETQAKLDIKYKHTQNLSLLSGVEYTKQEDEVENSQSELYSVYTAANLSLEKWFYDLGLRFDDFSSIQSNNSNVIGSAGAGYRINNEISLKAHISQGFKLPTLYQLANQVDDLKPTDSINTEFIFSYNTIMSQFEAAIFNYDLKNQIDYDTTAFGYDNIAKSQIQGIELNHSIEFKNSFNIKTSLTFQSAKNETDDSDLLRTPKQLGSLILGYQISKNQRLINNWQYVGKRKDVGGELPSYVVGNFTYHYKNFSFKVLNILDKDYENVEYYGTMPRSYYLSYKLSF